MSKDELFQKIKDAYEMVIKVENRKFTICDEYEKGYSIAEWDKPETEKYFDNPESLVTEFMINGENLSSCAEKVEVVDYTGFVM